MSKSSIVSAAARTGRARRRRAVVTSRAMMYAETSSMSRCGLREQTMETMKLIEDSSDEIPAMCSEKMTRNGAKPDENCDVRGG